MSDEIRKAINDLLKEREQLKLQQKQITLQINELKYKLKERRRKHYLPGTPYGGKDWGKRLTIYNLKQEGKTFTEIGEILGLSVTRISEMYRFYLWHLEANRVPREFIPKGFIKSQEGKAG